MAFLSGLRPQPNALLLAQLMGAAGPSHPLLAGVARAQQNALARRPLTQEETRQAVSALLPPPPPPPPPPQTFRPSGSIRPYEPTAGERIGGMFGNAARGLGFSNSYAGRLSDEAGHLPIVGDLMNAGDAGSAYRRGNYGEGLGLTGLAAIGLIPGAGDAAAQGARRAFGRLQEIRRDGPDRFLEYTTDDGQAAYVHVMIGPNGAAEISIDPFSRQANRFGAAAVRDAARQLKQIYPEITSVNGERLSGAAPGRVQEVRLPR